MCAAIITLLVKEADMNKRNLLFITLLSLVLYKTFSISDSGLISVQIPQPWLTTARMYSSGQLFSRKISSVL